MKLCRRTIGFSPWSEGVYCFLLNIHLLLMRKSGCGTNEDGELEIMMLTKQTDVPNHYRNCCPAISKNLIPVKEFVEKKGCCPEASFLDGCFSDCSCGL